MIRKEKKGRASFSRLKGALEKKVKNQEIVLENSEGEEEAPIKMAKLWLVPKETM